MTLSYMCARVGARVMWCGLPYCFPHFLFILYRFFFKKQGFFISSIIPYTYQGLFSGLDKLAVTVKNPNDFKGLPRATRRRAYIGPHVG